MPYNDGKSEMYRAREISCRRMGNFFTIFAHATRMRIFCALENGPKTVTRIAEEADITVPNASQHLRLMRDRGAVVTERRGQSIYYRMADQRFFAAANLIRDALGEQREDAEECEQTGGCSGEGRTHAPALETDGPR